MSVTLRCFVVYNKTGEPIMFHHVDDVTRESVCLSFNWAQRILFLSDEIDGHLKSANEKSTEEDINEQ